MSREIPRGWTVEDPWGVVVGNDDAVAQLRGSVDHPVHSYLLIGQPGWGPRAAADVFAGELLAAGVNGEDADRARTLATQGVHPAIIDVQRVGASISVDQAREIVRQASLAPIEGDRQVVILHDFHLVSRAAPTLLKTIEEPPESTVFVILADEITEDLVTIASRCVQVRFGPIPPATIADALTVDGADDATAQAIAAVAGGDLDRARVLRRDEGVSARRGFWTSLRSRVDGTGATAADLVDEALEHLDEISAPFEAAFVDERDRLAAEVEAGHATKADLNAATEHHKRNLRRVRNDELSIGLATVMASFRHAVIDNTVCGEDFVGVAERSIETVERVKEFNATERLQLLNFIRCLPAA